MSRSTSHVPIHKVHKYTVVMSLLQLRSMDQCQRVLRSIPVSGREMFQEITNSLVGTCQDGGSQSNCHEKDIETFLHLKNNLQLCNISLPALVGTVQDRVHWCAFTRKHEMHLRRWVATRHRQPENIDINWLPSTHDIASPDLNLQSNTHVHSHVFRGTEGPTLVIRGYLYTHIHKCLAL